MPGQIAQHATELALQNRIEELERENHRISKELEERRRLEQTLRESEYRFRTMADGTPIIIWVTNAAGDIEFINKAYTEFFGITLDNVRSLGWRMLVHPSDQIKYSEEYLYCHRNHLPFDAQGRIYRKDGQWRWIESFGQPRFSENGEFLGMAGSSLDITDRFKAEEALRENEAKFHDAFENAVIGFAMVAPAGHFVDMNEAYCRLSGFSREELLAMQYFQLIHPDDSEKNIQLMGQLLANEITSFVIENRYVRKNGQVAWVRKNVSSVVAPGGEPKWFLTLVEELPNGRRGITIIESPRLLTVGAQSKELECWRSKFPSLHK